MPHDDDGSAAQPQAAAVQEPAVPAEGAVETEDRPKDTRSLEERMAALKKPNPVPQPDEEKLNQHISSLNAKIDKCDKRLVRFILIYDVLNPFRSIAKSQSPV
jgi:hypothetical protein